MRLIGIEEHFLTAEVRQAWNAIGLEAPDPPVLLFNSGPMASLLARTYSNSSDPR